MGHFGDEQPGCQRFCRLAVLLAVVHPSALDGRSIVNLSTRQSSMESVASKSIIGRKSVQQGSKQMSSIRESFETRGKWIVVISAARGTINGYIRTYLALAYLRWFQF